MEEPERAGDQSPRGNSPFGPTARSLSQEELERFLRENDELIEEIGRLQTRPIEMSELRRLLGQLSADSVD